MQLWFGSSGGGLPGRPELKSLGRFLILGRTSQREAPSNTFDLVAKAYRLPGDFRASRLPRLATSPDAMHPIEVLR